MSVCDSREARGRVIANNANQITRLSEKHYRVVSQSGNGTYDVSRTKAVAVGWICTCPDYTYREIKCKHIWAVEFSLKIREAVEPLVIEPITNVSNCMFCQSANIVRDGLRHNRYGDIQKWNCKACGRYFTINIGFERMKHNPQGITTAMQLYFSGESLRNTAKSLKLIGVDVSYRTILNWIQKYTALMEKYLDKITPQVSDTWRADELYLKVRGNMKYLFAMMDDETRFWIAQEVADTKHNYDARRLFRKARDRIGRKPKALITDGLPAYREAYLKEYYTHKLETRTEHIHSIRIQGDKNNNKMERLNGEIRDREKVMRGLKKPETPIIPGYQIYHNYVRPHEALGGKTPAEACGIEVKGENKWLTLIQNASRERKALHEHGQGEQQHIF